jgi:hypothetical protein
MTTVHPYVLAAAAAWLLLGLSPSAAAADTKPRLPPITEPILFNTPQADQVLRVLQLFPVTSAWHEDISRRPVHPDSDQMIAHVGAGGHLAWNEDMAFVIVPSTQPRVVVPLSDYATESDPGPYPVPDNAPIEGWPASGGSLDAVQRSGDGDRHLIVLDPTAGRLYEFYHGRRTNAGWTAAGEATFDLTSNALRPAGWTSSDAAGLPILPAIVRYDECARGVIDHALRFTIHRSRKAYVYPATHSAGSTTDATVARMGERFRLKAGVRIDDLPPFARVVAQALKTYGMFVADNGGDWRISVAPDRRIQGLEALKRLAGSDFEVIVPTSEHEGPRAPGSK